jgi:hypothetical protein
MATREAACHCGQLRVEVRGEPLAVSLCHCLACQRRTGSAFGMQAGFKADQVEVADCGSQLFYTEPDEPDHVVISVGCFADPSFPPPTESSYDSRRHHWLELPDSVQRHSPELWDPVRPLYEAGRYAEAAEHGRQLIEAHPDQANLYYNTACCLSLAGQSAEAVEHLRRAIELWDGCRELATGDSDFDPIRSEPGFRELLDVARSSAVDTGQIAAFHDFADLPADELAELAGAMREVEFEAGAQVVSLDDYGTAIYFIESGQADVLTDGGEATESLGPGDTFGEISLLLTGQRTATVVARTSVRLLSLSGQDFERIRGRVPELERSLRRLAVERAGR